MAQMDTKADPLVESHLRAHGPILASGLARALHADGLSLDAARKRVERAGGAVRHLEHVRLARGERLYYLHDHGDVVGEALRFHARETRSAIRWPLETLDGIGGAIEEHRFRVISAVPRGRKGRVDDNQLAEALLSDGVLSRLTVAGRGTFLTLQEPFGTTATAPKRLAAKSLAATALRNALQDWIRRNTLGSYERVRVRAPDVDPDVAGYGWDITAPSYLWPLISRTEKSVKPGFLVCDVFMEPELLSVDYYLSKLEAIAAHSRNRPLLPLIVSPGFAKESFDRLKNRGVMVTTPDNLFGRGVGRALLRLVDLLTNAALAIANRGEEVFDVMSKVSRIEGAALNLRGALFEMIAGHCAREEAPGGFLDLGIPVKDAAGSLVTDIDVFYRHKRSVLVCECKGHSGNTVVTKEEVQAWLDKLPRVRRWLYDEYDNPDMRFEFWTSGQFEPAALEQLLSAEEATKKYLIKHRDGRAMEAAVRTLGGKHITDLYREHYSRHPLASAGPEFDTEASVNFPTK